MSPPLDESPLSDASEPNFAVIGSYRTARAAHEAGLSILACGQHYWLRVSEGRYLLVVPRGDAERLREEVALTERRNRYWPPPSLDLPSRSISKFPSGLMVALLVVAFYLQTEFPQIRELGANSSEAVLESGQWWRLVTAITLHADIGHLAGNLMGIALFGYLGCRYLGNGLAWTLVLGAAAFSNLTNALLNAGRDYVSLGASTAVFAALGLLSGFPIGSYLKSRDPIQTRDWLIPFFGGCVLFAWMGGGEFPTDVPAHLWSFAYGLALSAAAAAISLQAKLSAAFQKTLFGVSLGAIGACWLLALK